MGKARSLLLLQGPVWGSTLVWSSPALRYYTRVEVIGSGKHSSLLRYGNNYCRKKFYEIASRCKLNFLSLILFRKTFDQWLGWLSMSKWRHPTINSKKIKYRKKISPFFKSIMRASLQSIDAQSNRRLKPFSQKLELSNSLWCDQNHICDNFVIYCITT